MARTVALTGFIAGLLASLVIDAGGLPGGSVVIAAGLASACSGLGRRGLLPGIACGALALGAWVGGERIEGIGDGAIAQPGAGGGPLTVTGDLAAVPRTFAGESSLRLDTPAGRILVRVPGPPPEVAVGAELTASGRAAAPQDWERGWLRRQGIATVLRTRLVQPTGASRGGLAGVLDGIRSRAERALGEGMDPRRAALARGFVLGQDERIDEATRDEFKRSGLAHLLAVSGQNVILLVALATPLLALVGVPRSPRIIVLLVLVAVYVPIAGAGPSIQRAGVMGAAGLIAALAERPVVRWYAIAVAAAVTLAINPFSYADVGWQLSFAAVIGILIWTRPLSGRILRATGEPERRPASMRAALADGTAMTIAATVATAPLMAHHFEAVSLAALPANILVLPAVAPVMWMGMLAGIVGQLPVVPLGWLNWLDAALISYIEQVAHWFSGPGWAQVGVSLPGAAAVALAYITLLAAGLVLGRVSHRYRGLRPPPGAVALPGVAILVALAIFGVDRGNSAKESRTGSLRIEVLDVGQGDAILLDPPGGEPVLVDTGPPGAAVVDRLTELGVDSLRALMISHDQSDHSGNGAQIIERLSVERLIYGARPERRLLAIARAGGTRPLQLTEGSEFRSGALTLRVLWPPGSLVDRYASTGADPNLRSLVVLARFRDFSMLLTGDGEAEALPLDPGPIDVLKVAHHGSDDSGLAGLLDHTAPRLSVISVGAGNPFGHPTSATLDALADHGTTILRTDQDGPIEIEVGRRGWTVR